MFSLFGSFCPISIAFFLSLLLMRKGVWPGTHHDHTSLKPASPMHFSSPLDPTKQSSSCRMDLVHDLRSNHGSTDIDDSSTSEQSNFYMSNAVNYTSSKYFDLFHALGRELRDGVSSTLFPSASGFQYSQQSFCSKQASWPSNLVTKCRTVMSWVCYEWIRGRTAPPVTIREVSGP